MGWKVHGKTQVAFCIEQAENGRKGSELDMLGLCVLWHSEDCRQALFCASLAVEIEFTAGMMRVVCIVLPIVLRKQWSPHAVLVLGAIV